MGTRRAARLGGPVRRETNAGGATALRDRFSTPSRLWRRPLTDAGPGGPANARMTHRTSKLEPDSVRHMIAAPIAPASLAQSSSVSETHQTARVELYGTAFLKEPVPPPPFQTIVWASSPSEGLMNRSIPRTERGHGNVRFTCAGFDQRGRLSACVLREVDPQGKGYGAAGWRLIRGYTADLAFVASVRPHLDWIEMTFSLSNTLGSPFPGPCWPPFCVREPAPPSPPKS